MIHTAVTVIDHPGAHATKSEHDDPDTTKAVVWLHDMLGASTAMLVFVNVWDRPAWPGHAVDLYRYQGPGADADTAITHQFGASTNDKIKPRKGEQTKQNNVEKLPPNYCTNTGHSLNSISI